VLEINRLHFVRYKGNGAPGVVRAVATSYRASNLRNS